MFLKNCVCVLIFLCPSYGISLTIINPNDFQPIDRSGKLSQTFDDNSFQSKKKLLSYIRAYLAVDEKMSVKKLDVTMQQLAKESFETLTQKYEQNLKFVSRYTLLEYIKIFLIRYRNLSQDKVNNEINKLQKLSSEQIKNKYYQWCRALSKNQMLEIIHEHEQFNRGFSGHDADEVVSKLAQKPLSEIRDKFMQYQHTFVTKDIIQESDETIQQYKLQREKVFTQQQSHHSLISRVPLVHNTLKLLPSSITSWSEREVYLQIQKQMENLGFDQDDIQSEIKRLQSSSVETLEHDYAHLQEQLAQRLYYFDTMQHPRSDAVKTADFWLQQVHQWGSTAAMVVSYGASAVGYDPTLLNMVAGLTLLNPIISYASGYKKRDLLDMIYAQYATFDVLKSAYFSPEHKVDQLLTKAELLARISQCLIDLKISSKGRKQQEIKYQNYSKEELEELYQELDYFAHDEQRPKLSDFEKKIVQNSKLQLLQIIRNGCSKLKISDEETNQIIKKLGQENIKLLRAAALDMHEYLSHPPIILHKIPAFFSNIETLLRQAPKSLATSELILDHFSNNLREAGKDEAYIHWKVAALKDYVSHNHRFEDISLHADKAQQAYSLFRGHQDFLQHVHSAARPIVETMFGK